MGSNKTGQWGGFLFLMKTDLTMFCLTPRKGRPRSFEKGEVNQGKEAYRWCGVRKEGGYWGNWGGKIVDEVVITSTGKRMGKRGFNG